MKLESSEDGEREKKGRGGTPKRNYVDLRRHEGVGDKGAMGSSRYMRSWRIVLEFSTSQPLHIRQSMFGGVILRLS
jgi:hypothetical protein